MSRSSKKHSLAVGASLGAAATLGLVVVLGLAAGAGAQPSATPPSNTSPPTISGTAQKGQRLHADPGSWSGTRPMSFAYQWQRCGSGGANCSNISGARGHDYVLTSADVGNTVRVVVTATNSAGSAGAASSPTAVVAAPKAPANTVPPTISGAPQLGQTLTANPGTWSGPGPITLSYQWRRCDQFGGNCGFIAGALSQTYVPGSADVGHALRVRVTARNPFGSTSATSVPTAAVSATANGCPIGVKVVSVSQISLPARLVVDAMHFTPSVLRLDSRQLVARIHVSDTCNQSVQGALVYVAGVPYNQIDAPPTAVTDSTGWATLSFQMLAGYPVTHSQQLLALFVRASKPGENVLAGISTRRLVSVPVVH
ncbi:MAG TPA: hypothetical protein VLJ76_08020 [Gaiellaceae bacterium]|nr:hypothetical protein [Gaiellaceae bacterium]